MDNINHFKDLFESVQDYRKVLLLIVLIKTHVDLFRECGLWKVILRD